jgi:hypothetical protein
MKLDIIALSQKRIYKIVMVALLGTGLVVMLVGFVMLSGVTPQIPPDRLNVDMSSKTTNGSIYMAKVTLPETVMIIDTGTGTNALTSPIVFSLNADAKQFIKEIPDMWRCGIAKIVLKDTAEKGDSGYLTISCGQFSVVIEITAFFDS